MRVGKRTVPGTFPRTDLRICSRAQDVVWPDGKDSLKFVMAVSDGGLASTNNRGLTWQRTSEMWPGALGEATSKGTAVTAAPGSRCLYAAHTTHVFASVLEQCDDDSWSVIGGLQYSGGPGQNGIPAGTKYIRSLYVLPSTGGTTAVRLLAASGQAFLEFNSARPAGNQWHSISIPEPCGVGKAVVDSIADKAWTACGKSVYMLDLKIMRVTRVEINMTAVDSKGQPQLHQLRKNQRLTTLLAWPDVEGSTNPRWRVVLGTQYPPQIFDGLLTVSENSASATVKLSFDPKDLYNSSAQKAALELMTVTTIARTPKGDIACGLFVGNYFDGDLPPAIYLSTDGAKSWAQHPHKIANTNVRNMVVDPHGKLCMATDGCGLVCVPGQKEAKAAATLNINATASNDTIKTDDEGSTGGFDNHPGTWYCNLTSCDAGYHCKRASCIASRCGTGEAPAQPCNTGAGTGFQICSRMGVGVGQCHATRCRLGFTLSSGGCFRLTMTADPPMVAMGGSSTLRWAIHGALSCVVTGNGLTLWTGVVADVNTSAYGRLTKDTVYVLTCEMKDGTQQGGRVTVRVPVQAPAANFTFAAVRGANIMDQDNGSEIAWFSNTQRLAPIATRMNLNRVRINMDLSQAVDQRTSSRVGGQVDFLRTLAGAMDSLSNQSIKAILVFGVEPSATDTVARCPSNESFMYVRALAQQIVATFGSHPALHSFEMLNEAYTTMGDGNKCNKVGIRTFVVAMYELVRTLAPSALTSVSEAWFWWYIPAWRDVSPHAVPTTI